MRHVHSFRLHKEKGHVVDMERKVLTLIDTINYQNNFIIQYGPLEMTTSCN